MDKKKREPESGGDPYPDPQPLGGAPVRWRLRRRPSLLAIGIILSLAFSSYSALAVSGALRQQFPNTQVFSVGVAYSFANSQGSVLLPGGNTNVTLTINSAVSNPTTLYLEYNASDPTDWSTPIDQLNCCPHQFLGVTRSLTMTINGQILAPVDSDQAFTWAGQTAPFAYPITVSQGVNNYRATISVSSTATLSTTFSLTWTASSTP